MTKRFKVAWGHSAIALEEALNSSDEFNDYEVKAMSSSSWFDKDEEGISTQTGDSVYVLLELRRGQ